LRLENRISINMKIFLLHLFLLGLIFTSCLHSVRNGNGESKAASADTQVHQTGVSEDAEANPNILPADRKASQKKIASNIKPAAELTDLYFKLLKSGKKVAVVANQTSMIGSTHLVDSLINTGINVVKVFTPEHGFRGIADAGARIENEIDRVTGLPIISLYGNHKKPTPEDLKDIDIVVFDLQDVGARFYTYISTMTLVMEACAEQKVPVLILDRPNPNGFYVDGPILEPQYQSFVGMHPVPVVHGMTMAEYARMVNGEGWLKNGIKCELKWVECSGYDHNSFYELPVKPSPNLPDFESVLLYPSLCFFEGTRVSVGRGTEYPFSVIGHPDYDGGNYSFTPIARPGAMNPPYKGQKCYGYNLRDSASSIMKQPGLQLQWLITMYNADNDKSTFFTPFFSKLAGTEKLRKQIEAGMSESAIKHTWAEDLKQYKKRRSKYLLYSDFNNVSN
jgi:uncharacterized protein YbbC (DUF1343 family)